MTEQKPTYHTATPAPVYELQALTLDGVLAVFESWAEKQQMMRREALLTELGRLESSLGYGGNDKPTTRELRAWWRERGATCQHCGVKLSGKREG